MPFYDFQCANDHRFELKQSFNAAPTATCPTCTKPARRLISLVPVHFKGSGFYVNDYGRKEPPRDGDGKGVGKPATGEKAAAGDKAAKQSPEAVKSSEPAKSAETSEESAPAATGAR